MQTNTINAVNVSIYTKSVWCFQPLENPFHQNCLDTILELFTGHNFWWPSDLVNLKFNPGLVISKETQMALSKPLNNNVRFPFFPQWQHVDVKQVSMLDEKSEYHQASHSESNNIKVV